MSGSLERTARPPATHGVRVMLPLRISNATRILAESQDEYIALAIRDEVIGGINHMSSVWEPTPQELADLMPNASARGSATTPTVMPARMSPFHVRRSPA